MQGTESQAEFLHESHGTLQTERPSFFFFLLLLPPPPLKSESLRLLHIGSLSRYISACRWSFHLCLLPFCDSHGRLPVCVRRASSQSAVKAVILLVAIYYPVVCLKKDWKRAKLGAGCWVSRHAKLQSESTTDLYTCLPFCFWKCVYFYFLRMCCRSLGVHLFAYRVSHSAAGSARWHFFVAAEGRNVLLCKFWR